MRNVKGVRRSSFKIITKLLSLIGSLAYVIVIAVINGSVGHIIGTFIPILGAIAIAKTLGAFTSISYEVLIGLLVGFGLLRGLLRYFEQYANHYIAFKLLAKIRDIIFAKLRVLSPAKLETKQKGTIISMITADTETIEVFYAHTISPVCIAFLVSLTIFLFIGFVSSWYMALFAVFAYVVVGVIIPIISRRVTKREGGEYRQKFTEFNGYFVDSIKGSKDIILHGKEAQKQKTVENHTDKLLSATKSLKDKSLSMNVVTNTTVIVLNIIMLVIGILLVHYSDLGVGNMFVAVVALMSSYGPVLSLAALPTDLSQTLASGDRLISLLEEEPVVEDIKNGKDFEFENLKTKKLCFAYDEANPVLKDLEIEVTKGEIVGIVGSSGCGKSTVFKLLLRFYDKDSGEILFNDVDINNINTDSLKKNVTMVSQKTYLFDDTIKGNLLIAKQNATDEEIVEACKKAGIHNLISQLKQGYDTKVGGANASLSAGETQRIGIARAFLSDAKLILLDEPTSNVDAINEGIILKSLLLNKEDKAIIIVSHRESTISIADRVYRFDSC